MVGDSTVKKDFQMGTQVTIKGTTDDHEKEEQEDISGARSDFTELNKNKMKTQRKRIMMKTQKEGMMMMTLTMV